MKGAYSTQTGGEGVPLMNLLSHSHVSNLSPDDGNKLHLLFLRSRTSHQNHNPLTQSIYSEKETC